MWLAGSNSNNEEKKPYMKTIIAVLVLVGLALSAHAGDGENRTFEITVREVLPDGKVASVGDPSTITVRCGKPEAIRVAQETTSPSNPPQAGPGVVFTGHIETGCGPSAQQRAIPVSVPAPAALMLR